LWGSPMAPNLDLQPSLNVSSPANEPSKAPRMAAVLSYGTAFSMAPLLILAISIARPVLGDDAAQEEDQSTSRTIDTLRPLETRFMIPHSNELLGKAPHHGAEII
jgi:hypothetical protein